MQESLSLFESVISLEWFRHSSVILSMTKLDLFREKIQSKPIHDYFPDYTGRSNDSDAARAFSVNKLLAFNQDPGRNIHVYCTDVTDTDGCAPVLHSIMDIAIDNQAAWAKKEHTRKQDHAVSGQVKHEGGVGARVVSTTQSEKTTTVRSKAGERIGRPFLQGSSHPVTQTFS